VKPGRAFLVGSACAWLAACGAEIFETIDLAALEQRTAADAALCDEWRASVMGHEPVATELLLREYLEGNEYGPEVGPERAVTAAFRGRLDARGWAGVDRSAVLDEIESIGANPARALDGRPRTLAEVYFGLLAEHAAPLCEFDLGRVPEGRATRAHELHVALAGDRVHLVDAFLRCSSAAFVTACERSLLGRDDDAVQHLRDGVRVGEAALGGETQVWLCAGAWAIHEALAALRNFVAWVEPVAAGEEHLLVQLEAIDVWASVERCLRGEREWLLVALATVMREGAGERVEVPSTLFRLYDRDLDLALAFARSRGSAREILAELRERSQRTTFPSQASMLSRFVTPSWEQLLVETPRDLARELGLAKKALGLRASPVTDPAAFERARTACAGLGMLLRRELVGERSFLVLSSDRAQVSPLLPDGDPTDVDLSDEWWVLVPR
jgi:hypothetical protein